MFRRAKKIKAAIKDFHLFEYGSEARVEDAHFSTDRGGVDAELDYGAMIDMKLPGGARVSGVASEEFKVADFKIRGMGNNQRKP